MPFFFDIRRRPACAALLAAAAVCLVPQAAIAAGAVGHPWVSAAPKLAEAENYITNLRDGDKIETPFLLKFGLSQYGLAGISDALPKTGHHHLLINRDLPLDFSKPLPFNDQYVHFGKGQMETVLTLKPGSYTLRMLLADQKHIPLFIYSPKISVTVTASHPEIRPASLVTPGVSILSPRDGDKVGGPFLLRLHASGLNVGHEQVKANDAGHFRLMLRSERSGTETIELKRGQTEVWLKPPPGSYRALAQFISNATGKLMHQSPEQTLLVH